VQSAAKVAIASGAGPWNHANNGATVVDEGGLETVFASGLTDSLFVLSAGSLSDF
jgi:hypothetical protein